MMSSSALEEGWYLATLELEAPALARAIEIQWRLAEEYRALGGWQLAFGFIFGAAASAQALGQRELLDELDMLLLVAAERHAQILREGLPKAEVERAQKKFYASTHTLAGPGTWLLVLLNRTRYEYSNHT